MRVIAGYAALMMWGAGALAPGPSPFAFVPPAHAQAQLDQATQDLFVAVDANDLNAVKAAIENGADIGAADFNGMQPVDLAIDRGYFDIAHFLISVRNQLDAQAQGEPPAPAPSADELAARAGDKAQAQNNRPPVETDPFAMPDATTTDTRPDAGDDGADTVFPDPPAQPDLAPSQSPAPDADAPMDAMSDEGGDGTSDAPNPFDSPPADGGLEVIGDVRAPETGEAPPARETASPTTSDTPDAPEMDDADGADDINQDSNVEVIDKPGVTLGGETDTPTTNAPTPGEAPPGGDKPSATKQFLSTFFDFFKPPNTTGIVREDTSLDNQAEDAVTDEDISRQIEELEKEAGTRAITQSNLPVPTDGTGETDAPPLSGGGELPPYRVAPPTAPPPETPQIAGEDAFGDLQVGDAPPEPETDTEPPAQTAATGDDASESGKAGDIERTQSALDTSRPFGGGVDPDILALLGMDGGNDQGAPKDPFAGDGASDAPSDPFADSDESDAPADPFANAEGGAAEDPFAAPESDGDSVSTILKDIDRAENVTELATRKPPPPDADPFAGEAPADPFASPEGEVDELAGLLETTGEEVSAKPDGWDVKEVEGGALPDDAPILANLEPSGEALDGVELTLGMEATIGQPVGEERLEMLELETIHKPCITKGGPETVYCVDKINWPFELEENFLVDTIMYQGTRAITRYDAGRATRFHALFQTDALAKVVKFYTDRYGPPTEVVERAIAPLAQPRRDNPTYIWRSREPGTDTMTILELRKFDDARNGFPDTKRGAILLYREHAGSIFPQLSQLELMVLKDSGAPDLQPKTPDSVW